MFRHNKRVHIPLHLMLLPGMILILIYELVPMAGLIIAFQDFSPVRGVFRSEWIGLDNFRYVLNLPNIREVLWNTVYISLMKILAGQFTAIFIAVLLNEVGKQFFKRTVQTMIYLPHFLSWVILGGVLIDLLSPSTGIVNQFLKALGIEPIFFLGHASLFPYTLVVTDIWKEFGFNTIVYLTALTSINPALYEAAVIDGADRWKQTIYITLPGMTPTIVLLATLSLGQVLNAGFDQVFNLYSPQVYDTGDIIDTFVYRIGLVEAQYGVATAVGLFKSVVSFVFVSLSYYLAYRTVQYRIF